MAFSVSLSTCFSPQALARPKKLSKNPNPNPKPKTRNFPTPTPLTSSAGGGEATTYTCLPPKDDFSLPSLHQSSTVVKLSDSKPPSNENKTVNEELIGEEKVELGFDYGKFELFEVNSDSDNESGEDIYEDDTGNGLLGFSNEQFDNVFDGDGIEEEEVKEKEKGVPAVMRCFDRAKIYVKAGDGGNGVVAFRREKFVPFGGPSGGDGGRGGNVYVEVDGDMNSLLPFRKNIHFRAGRGAHGLGSKQSGAKGENVVVKVAPGTVVREAGRDGIEGDVLLELLHPGQRALLLPGGRGGRGNASFKTGVNKAPRIAENGEEGPEMMPPKQDIGWDHGKSVGRE